jgi:hypothetical protein
VRWCSPEGQRSALVGLAAKLACRSRDRVTARRASSGIRLLGSHGQLISQLTPNWNSMPRREALAIGNAPENCKSKATVRFARHSAAFLFFVGVGYRDERSREILSEDTQLMTHRFGEVTSPSAWHPPPRCVSRARSVGRGSAAVSCGLELSFCSLFRTFEVKGTFVCI